MHVWNEKVFKAFFTSWHSSGVSVGVTEGFEYSVNTVSEPFKWELKMASHLLFSLQQLLIQTKALPVIRHATD